MSLQRVETVFFFFLSFSFETVDDYLEATNTVQN